MNSSNRSSALQKVGQLGVDGLLLVGLIFVLFFVQVFDRPAVDLVFIIDQQPVMKSLLESIQSNCVEKAQALAASGSDCRFAVISFGGKQNRVPLVPLTADFKTFQQQLMASPTDTQASWPRSTTEALKQVLTLDFRQHASVIVILISKQPVTEGQSIASVADEMDRRGICTIVQADVSEQERCLPLYQSGGRFYSMEGKDVTESNRFAHAVTKSGNRKTNLNLLATLSPEKTSDVGGVKGIFALRTALNRAEIIEALGGNEKSEFAVQEGLNWLARHQGDDGHWSEQGKCDPGHPCERLTYTATVAETGLAILAFQAGGNYYFNNRKYSATVTRGLDWLVGHQKPDGCLFGSTSTWYEHGIATFALVEACAVAMANAETPNPRYLSAARRAITFIEDHQYQVGGWQYAEQGLLGDSSVTGWQMLAIKSAMEAEFDISKTTIEKLTRFFAVVGDPATGRTGYQSRGGGTDLTTAVGFIFQKFILGQPHSELAEKAIANLTSHTSSLEQTMDYYTLYNCTLALFLARGDAWKQWNDVIRDAIVKHQSQSADCTRGSWIDVGASHKYQRTLSTAWAVLTLEVYYRYAAEGDDAHPPVQ